MSRRSTSAEKEPSRRRRGSNSMCNSGVRAIALPSSPLLHPSLVHRSASATKPPPPPPPPLWPEIETNAGGANHVVLRAQMCVYMYMASAWVSTRCVAGSDGRDQSGRERWPKKAIIRRSEDFWFLSVLSFSCERKSKTSMEEKKNVDGWMDDHPCAEV